MSTCRRCGGPLTVQPSVFPDFNLLGCEPCDRPIRLVPIHGSRVPVRRISRADENRALRAARRMKAAREAKG